MTNRIFAPPPGFTKPPGTVRLIREDGELERPGLILQPSPSHDPNDPLNWSRNRKILNFIPTLTITVLIFTQTCLPVIFWVLWIPEFGWTYEQLNTAQALGLVGTSIGCFFFIPPTVKYGRRLSYILMVAIIAAMCLWSARMQTLTELYISGFLFGLANATNEAIVQMTIADLFFVHQRGTANGLYVAAVMIGSFLSPVVTGYMAADGNWRLCYWVLLAFEIPLLCYFCLFFEETKYIPPIEACIVPTDNEALQAGTITCKVTSSSTVQSNNENNQEEDLIRHTTSMSHHVDQNIPPYSWWQRRRLITKTDESLWMILWQSLVILFKFPAVMYTAITYAFALCWVSAQSALISIVFTAPPYNFGTAGVGNMSLGVFVGCIMGAIYGALTDRALNWFARRNYGYYEPESRLHLNHLPALCIGGGFITFGVTSAKGMHWIYPSIGSAIFGFGIGCLADVAMCLVMDSYQGVTGEAFISIAFVRNLFSIVIFMVIVPWLNKQGLQNMTITQGVCATIIALIYFPILYYGKMIREKTAQRYTDMVNARGGSRL